MFGYVQPLTCELRVRDKSMYDAYYCGLCSVLKKEYGIASQALLSYDCAFIAILLSAPNEHFMPETIGNLKRTDQRVYGRSIVDFYTYSE